MRSESCKTCVFAHELQAAMPDGQPIVGQMQLVCKAAPPQLVVLPVAPGQVQMSGMFPPVEPDLWCGHYEASDDTAG